MADVDVVPLPIPPKEPRRPKRRDLGGEGSGNFGHSGRPGEIGGSARSSDALLTPEEKAVREGEYAKLQQNREKQAEQALRSAETGPGGRFETFEQRQSQQLHIQRRLGDIMGPGKNAYISSPTPNLIRTGELTAEVLERMKADGLAMPDRIMITTTGHESTHAAVRGVTITTRDAETGEMTRQRQERHLQINIPDTLPEDADLDGAVTVAFGGPSTVNPKQYSDRQYAEYDRFASRNLTDVIVHEMGHVQAGHRGETKMVGKHDTSVGFPVTDLLQSGKFGSTESVQRAAMRVSEYALGNQNEFLAEAYTRMYRGETLADDSMRLYEALNGPKVPKR